MNGDGAAIRLRDVSVEVAGQRLLDRVETTLPAGKITVVVGGSGAGKSVLLRILAGLMPRDDAPVRWTGNIAHADGRPLGRVGIVFQQFALFDEFSPTANVAFAVDHRRDRKQPPEQSPAEWLDELRVPARTPVAALSGGQKQRLAIARTLAADPEVLLYDEPTSGLDAASGRQVAELIRRTQQAHGRTSIVVTHDYATLLNIADHVLVLDAEARRLVEVPPEAWDRVAERMRPVATADGDPPGRSPSLPRRGLSLLRSLAAATGDAVVTALRLPWDALPRWPRPGWAMRFLGHYLWLVTGPSAIIYLLLAGVIVGFVTTFFTFRYLPFALYTKPLLLEDLLAAIGFALYRVLTPVLATVLVAARCGAAASADVGVKRYGGQTDALRTLGVRPAAYLLSPILLAFVIGTPLLEWVAFQAAQAVSLITFTATHPDIGPYFWDLHFHSRTRLHDRWMYAGSGWLVLKNLTAGIGTGCIAYYQGLRPKASAADVSRGITGTVLWATLYVLLVHFIVAFYEFG